MKKNIKRKADARTRNPKKISNATSIAKYVTSIAVGMVACCIGSYLFTGTLNSITVDFTLRKNFNVSCSKDYKDHPIFAHCTPIQSCGRIIQDNIVTDNEVEKLVHLAKRGFAHGGSSGGASILDLHSGALSFGDKFVNIFKYLDKKTLSETFLRKDFEFYAIIKSRVHKAIATEFGLDSSKLFLTSPTFFSRITNVTAKTQHDEYWHKHIDKIQYGSFDYTSLLYLTDYGKDFTGGRFLFDGENHLIVEPRKGRLSYFTSGSENPHHVEKVESGVRYAITISFTCDRNKSIRDPSIPR